MTIIVNNGRVLQELIDSLDLIGTGGLPLQMIPAVLPVKVVAEDDDQVTSRPAAGFGNQAATPAVNSKVLLFNPLSSGVDLLVHELGLAVGGSTNTASVSIIKAGADPGGATTAGIYTDGSILPADPALAPPDAAGRTLARTGGLLGDQFAELRCLVDEYFQVRIASPWRLQPDQGIEVRITSVNLTLRANFQWREVPRSSA